MQKAQKIHAAAVKVHKAAQPVFDKSEHAAAVGYAIMEFSHVHEIVLAASAVMLLALAVLLFGRGLGLLIALGGRIIPLIVR